MREENVMLNWNSVESNCVLKIKKKFWKTKTITPHMLKEHTNFVMFILMMFLSMQYVDHLINLGLEISMAKTWRTLVNQPIVDKVDEILQEIGVNDDHDIATEIIIFTLSLYRKIILNLCTKGKNLEDEIPFANRWWTEKKSNYF